MAPALKEDRKHLPLFRVGGFHTRTLQEYAQLVQFLGGKEDEVQRLDEDGGEVSVHFLENDLRQRHVHPFGVEKDAQLADDKADIWYNIGHIGIGIGNCDLAYQAFKISLSLDSEHAESLCNLGVLELQSRNTDAAQAIFRSHNPPKSPATPTIFKFC